MLDNYTIRSQYNALKYIVDVYNFLVNFFANESICAFLNQAFLIARIKREIVELIIKMHF